MQRTFRTCSEVLLPLYFSDPKISGSSDPQDHHDRLRGRLVREGRTEHYKEILDEVARQSSVCERRADEAERESDKLKKAEYMSYHLGEEYEGSSPALQDGDFMWSFRIPWKD